MFRDVVNKGVWKIRGMVENTGSQWKTWGLSEKLRETIISRNYEFSSLKWEVEFILLFQIAIKINSASRLGTEPVFRS